MTIFFSTVEFFSPQKLYPRPPLDSFSEEILTEITKGIYCTKFPPPKNYTPLTHFSKEILTRVRVRG
jgi:hypothetical protein